MTAFISSTFLDQRSLLTEKCAQRTIASGSSKLQRGTASNQNNLNGKAEPFRASGGGAAQAFASRSYATFNQRFTSSSISFSEVISKRCVIRSFSFNDSTVCRLRSLRFFLLT